MRRPEGVAAMRRHYDLSMDQRLRIAESLTVACDPPGRLSRHRGCGAPAGERCRNLATGQPLQGLGAHVGRLYRAREARPSHCPRSSPTSPPADATETRTAVSA